MPKKITDARPFRALREIPADLVADTLVSALEGGSGYWATIDNVGGPKYHEDKCNEIAAGYGHLLIIERDAESGPSIRKLDRAALRRGVEIMARDHQQHFADMVDDRGDAITGDVLLQCAVLGEVRYG